LWSELAIYFAVGFVRVFVAAKDAYYFIHNPILLKEPRSKGASGFRPVARNNGGGLTAIGRAYANRLSAR